MNLLKKTLAVIAVSFFSLTAFAADAYPETDAAVDIKAASAQTTDGQLMLVSFGANWCYNCRNLAKGLHGETLEGWVESNFQVVKVNVGSSGQNAATVEAFGNPTRSGIPAVVLADSNGKPIIKLPSSELIPAINGGDESLKAYLENAHAKALAML
jgi:protein disulfide-isomerase